MQVNLDWPLPANLAIGAGTALFVGGTCFDAEAEITSLCFVLNGQEQPVAAHGMPRLDHFRVLHPGLDRDDLRSAQSDPNSADDPGMRGYRSGFWGLVAVEPGAAGGTLELELRARLASGARRTVPLGTVKASDGRPAGTSTGQGLRAGSGSEAPVAVCMATYNPPLDLFQRQVDSIRAQTHGNWVCLISDDCSRPDRYQEIAQMVAGDRRFIVSRSERRLGFYLNFERALKMVPAEAGYVALSDQDDFWYSDKLATLLEDLGEAQLIYSDARIVEPGGAEVAPTYWGTRQNNHTELLSLLLANSVTGAACLFRREVLDYALPFPPAQFAHFHDHWIALTALALGGIRFVPRPLYDYVQHGGAALGHARATHHEPIWRRLRGRRFDARERVRVARERYFVDVMRLMAFASVLEMRCRDRLSGRHRRALSRFLSTDRSVAPPGRLVWGAARELAGRHETLDAEWAILQSLAWRRLLAATTTDRPRRRLRLDALPPAELARNPGRSAPPTAEPARLLWQKIAPLELAASEAAPRRVNILIPTIDLEHLFGGYIAKFNLAQRLAQRGVRVRLVTVDPVGPLPRGWQPAIESYSGLDGLFERVEVAFGRESGGLEVSRQDAFVATTWWTAHIARAALEELHGTGMGAATAEGSSPGFVYLIQEYEPMTFPMGAYSALAEQSYRFPHFALFSSGLLRNYFRRHAIGVYAAGDQAGDEASAAFENAITPVPAPTAERLAAHSGRSLLFYARPEPHASRNMFELGVLALQRAVQDGVFRGGWQLRGIGTLGGSRRVVLFPGVDLELLPRTGQEEYRSILEAHDVGLALMYTPHPSLVPIEMASAGLLAVTNTFENKTAEELARISPNLIAGEPTVEGIAEALAQAVSRADDRGARVRGAAVRWSRDWDESFDAELLARLSDYLAF